MLNQEKFDVLRKINQTNSISFYIPTHRVDGIQEDRILYKNVLSEIEKELSGKGLTPPEVSETLAQAQNKLGDEEFWRHLSDALAVFIYDNTTFFFELPIQIKTTIFIGPHLYLSPILPLLNGNDGFYALALSQNQIRVFEGTAYTLEEIIKNDTFPENVAEILRLYDPNTTLQTHSGGTDSSIFHGHGSGKDVENIRIEEYLRKVDEGIMNTVCDNDKKPLVLYTTPTLAGLYRKVNSYPHLVDQFAQGNPEDIDMYEIHEAVWPILGEQIVARENEQLAAFSTNIATNKAAKGLQKIAPAAFAGRVDTVYLKRNTEVWGKYIPETHQIECHTGRQADSQPLYHHVAMAVADQGGAVYIMDEADLPTKDDSVCAVFRYATA